MTPDNRKACSPQVNTTTPGLGDASDILAIHPALVAAVGAHGAFVLAFIHRGATVAGYTHGGRSWFRAPAEAIALGTGLTTKQVRGTLDMLVRNDHLSREQHILDGPRDRAYSYRILFTDEAVAA